MNNQTEKSEVMKALMISGIQFLSDYQYDVGIRAREFKESKYGYLF